MTLSSDAKDVFGAHGLDRDDARIAVKCVGQQVIDESAESETPLTGMVYDVWGLYNDGMPECHISVEGDEVAFTAQYRTEASDARVERRRTVPAEALADLAEVPGGAA
jgi:hypothetical protein